MRGQSRLTSHTRRNVPRPKADLPKKTLDTKTTTSVRLLEEVFIKPTKVEKPTQTKATRKSTRLLKEKFTQTQLTYNVEPKNQKETTKNTSNNSNTDKSDESESQSLPPLSKRKLEAEHTSESNKKQKTNKSEENQVVEETTDTTKVTQDTLTEETKVIAITPAIVTEGNDGEVPTSIETEPLTEITKEKETIEETKSEESCPVVIPDEENTITAKEDNNNTNNTNNNDDNKEEIQQQQQENTEQEEHALDFAQEITTKSTLSFSTESACSLVDDDSFAVDSPSPYFHSDPMTPPHNAQLSVTAPYKTILSPADKARINDEKSLLMKLRKALDIVITDRTAHNQPVLYHKVEPVLRNSTRRTIVIGHVSQIMYIAPNLYDLYAKEIRNFGGKATEAYLIEFGKEWVVPLVGKDLQKRSDILEHGINHYFDTHKEPYATIPKKELPKLEQVVNKKDWIHDAKLPPGVKSLLTAHERAKAVEAEKAKPKPTPKGSVKDRLAALQARLKGKKGL